MKNLVRDDEFPFTSSTGLVYDKCSLIESLTSGALAVNYRNLRKEHEELRKKGIYRGIGIATLLEIGGIGSAILGPAGFCWAGIRSRDRQSRTKWLDQGVNRSCPSRTELRDHSRPSCIG